MDYDPIAILLYFGGSIIQDSNGANYTGCTPVGIHVNPRIKLVELKSRIYSITGWSERDYDIGITARWQAGRGGRLSFLLMSITDDDSLTSIIRNTQAGKIDWSVVELYLEKLSRNAGSSYNAHDDYNTEEPNFDYNTEEPNFESQIPDEHNDYNTEEPNFPSSVDLTYGGGGGSPIRVTVESIIQQERNSYEGAQVNNELADLDDGDEAYPEEEEEEEDDDDDDDDDEEEGGGGEDGFVNYEVRAGVEHFRRITPGYFLEVDMAYGDMRGGDNNNAQRGDFYVGQEFAGGRDHLKNALEDWHIRNHREFLVIKSGPSVFTVKCKDHSRCPWRLHASKSKRKGSFLIKPLKTPHICVNQNLSRSHKNLTSKFISRCVLGLVRSHLGTTPVQIVEVIKEQYNYTISYGKAWRAKCKAMKYLFGGWREAYSVLPRMIMAIAQTNPGTVHKIWSEPTEVHGTHILRGFFWAFGPAIRAFESCRPLLSIDGTFLYGKYKGVLLIAMAIDANGQLLPVAYALVEKESNATWGWFMNAIRELVTQREGLCVISDRHKGILNVFKDRNNGWAPPKAYH